jgi:hypothetical protein
MLTIERILNGEWDPDTIRESDYRLIWAVLRMEIDRIQYAGNERKDGEWELMRNYQKLMDVLIEVHDQHTRLRCDQCGKNASWNTPVTDGAGRVLCATCCKDDDTDTVWYGIEQRSAWGGDMPLNQDPQRLSYYYRGVVVHADQRYHVERHAPGQVTRLYPESDWKEKYLAMKSSDYYSNPRFQFNLPSFSYMCWVEGGQQAFPLNDEEKRLDPEQLLKHVYEEYVIGNKYRCTGCKKDFLKPPAERPLFAGAVCPDCKIVHEEKLAEQSRKGQVCSMCHRPYGDCSC